MEVISFVEVPVLTEPSAILFPRGLDLDLVGTARKRSYQNHKVTKIYP